MPRSNEFIGLLPERVPLLGPDIRIGSFLYSSWLTCRAIFPMKSVDSGGGSFSSAGSPIPTSLANRCPNHPFTSPVTPGTSDNVAQICNLLYRRVALGRAPEARGRFEHPTGEQNAILRYGRLQICATLPLTVPRLPGGGRLRCKMLCFGRTLGSICDRNALGTIIQLDLPAHRLVGTGQGDGGR